MSLQQEEPTKICVDNKSSIALAKNLVLYDRSKHINIRYHYIRECIARKDVQVEYMKNQDQVAYIFTKSLKQEDFVRLSNLLGITKSIFGVVRGWVLEDKLDLAQYIFGLS